MTDNLAMTLITPHMEERVILAPHDLTDFLGFTFTEVRGHGRGRGQGDAHVSTELHLIYYRFLKLRLVCRSELADEICDRLDQQEERWCRIHDNGQPFRAHRRKAPGATL